MLPRAPVRGRVLERAGRVAAALVVAAAVPAGAQLAPAEIFEGPYDYVATGASLRSASNSSNACTVNGSATATVSGIPAGATVAAAYLYWAGSGSLDATVTFAGSSLTADRTWTDSYVQGSTTFNFFGAVADVTSRISGNGSYTLSGLTVATGAPYCASQAVLAGFALYVVYRTASGSPRRVQLHDGFQVVRQGSTSFTLTGFTGAASPSVRLTSLVWEGDPDISGSEAVRWNGTALTATGFAPANNVFNSYSTLGNNTHGLDLDTFTPTLASGATSATVQVSTGDDLVLLHAIATSIAVAPAYGVSVTPDGGTTQRLPGSGYTMVFTIENTSNLAITAGLIISGSGTPFFVAVTAMGGPGVTTTARADSFNVAIPFGETATFTVTYTVPPGPPATNVGTLRARVGAQPATFDDGWSAVERVSPQLALAKSVTPSGVVTRGSELTYEMAFSNQGGHAATAVAVVDEVPPQVAFRLGSAAQTLPGGLTATVAYSADGGSTWTYTPVSGGCGVPAGYDGCVQRVRWTLSGPLPTGAAASSGTVRFVAVIR